MVIRLSFFIAVHIDAKKLLKRFGFSQNSDINLPLTNKDVIAGIFYCKLVYLK